MEFPAADNLPVLPDLSPASDHPLAGEGATPPATVPPRKIALDRRVSPGAGRYVDGEFARVVVPLPAGKDGFHLKAGAPADQNELQRAW